MHMLILCPLGHAVPVRSSQTGMEVICPVCLAAFPVGTVTSAARMARPEKKKAKPQDDEDEEEDEEEVEKKPDTRTQKEPTPKGKYRDTDEFEDDRAAPPQEEAPPEIKWTRKKKQLQVVNNAMKMYLITFYVFIATLGMDALFLAFKALFSIFSFFGAMGLEGEEQAKTNLYMPLLFWLMGLIPFAIGSGAVQVCQFIAWVMGLFAPAKSEARSTALIALILFIFPVILLIIYFIIFYALVTRGATGARLLFVFLGIGWCCGLAAMYCSLIYIGRIAAYLGRTVDKAKPVALGWFVVGGYILWGLGQAGHHVTVFVLGPGGIMVPLILVVLSGALVYGNYMVIGAIRELIDVVNNIRKDIDTKILED